MSHIEKQLNLSTAFRRERKVIDTKPVAGVPDYGVSLTAANVALAHLVEGLPGGQRNRCINAAFALSAAASDLLQYLDAAGYFDFENGQPSVATTPEGEEVEVRNAAEGLAAAIGERPPEPVTFNAAQAQAVVEALAANGYWIQEPSELHLRAVGVRQALEALKGKPESEPPNVWRTRAAGNISADDIEGQRAIQREYTAAANGYEEPRKDLNGLVGHCFTNNLLSTIHAEAEAIFNVSPSEVNQLLADGWCPVWEALGTHIADESTSWLHSTNGLVYPNATT
jgi:hypothetical protein